MILRYIESTSNELIFAGKPVSQFASDQNSTPLYIYSSEIISQKVKILRESMPKDLEIHYAVKANPMLQLLKYVSTIVDGFDVASVGELERLIQMQIPASRISFAGPGKTKNELETAIRSGVLINAESINEIREIDRIAQQIATRPRVALRINPPFEAKLGGMKMGGGSKPFGIDSERLEHVFAEMNERQIPVEGLHVYAGSQMLNPDEIIQMHNQTFDLLDKYQIFLNEDFKVFNIGGGFGIPYFNGDKELVLDEIAHHLEIRMTRFRKNFPNCKVVLELGRYLVGECGLLLCRVVEKKISRGQTFLILDCGMNAHLAASGNLGQIVKRAFPILAVTQLNSLDQEKVSIVGPLCTPLDSFAQKLKFPKCQVGDLIGIAQSGAYGLTASPVYFLSHRVPREIFI